MSNAAARRSRPEVHITQENGDVHVHFDGDSLEPEDDADEVGDEVEVLENSSQPKSGGLRAKSGIIIGIHNMFVVIPQFISTGITSLVFALFDPDKSAVQHGHNPVYVLPGNGTVPVGAVKNGSDSLFLYTRAGEETAKPAANSVAIIFRLGGITTAIAFVLCWRLAREVRRSR